MSQESHVSFSLIHLMQDIADDTSRCLINVCRMNKMLDPPISEVTSNSKSPLSYLQKKCVRAVSGDSIHLYTEETFIYLVLNVDAFWFGSYTLKDYVTGSEYFIQ